ncbi:MAG: hypothetical protein EXX96DRAFT_479209 [Benjaminiella poitrasii]|nr:MAG: hypothetical protein EXX96DRAFT_479209 [Benjaminiella poitrasii]
MSNIRFLTLLFLFFFLKKDQRSNFSEPVLTEANEVFKSFLHKSDPESTDFDLLYSQIDYSQVVNIFDEKPAVNYKLEQISRSLISGTFICSELSKRILLILTTNSLIFCEERNDTKSKTKRYKQLYTPIEIEHVSMRAVQIERELVGEYNLQFCMQNLKTFTMKTNSKEDRNIWLGMDADSNIKDNSATCWLLLKDIVKNNNAYQQTEARKLKRSSLKSIRTKDVFSFYMDQSGEISPLVSSDDESKSDSDYVNHYKPLPQPCTQTNSNHPPSPPPKKKSFMKSVMTAMSSKTSSRSQKNRSKSSKQPDPVSVSGHHNSDMKNKSSASINQQTPSGSYSPFLNHPAPSSFTSLSSLNQSNVTLTPPLSISSSPRSLTPVSLSHYKTSSSSSFEDLGTPPESPELFTQGNMIKGILYSNNTFKVFHWKDESWYEVEGYCILEVRQTFSNRACIAVHMNTSGQLYLNAWVLPDTFICRTNETDLSLSLHITNNQSALETYLFHCESKLEADRLNSLLEQMHKESIKMNNIISAMKELSKTLKLVMQCKCKLYVQNGSSKWSNFGSVHMKVSQQYTTKKMHISIESHKGSKTTQLINAMVQSRNVERLSQKRISFMMVDELQKTSVVYMIQVREENTGDKIFEYIKTINAENGW